MIPGLTTKLSESVVSLETTIYPKSDILRITSTSSTTVMSTVIPAFSGQSGMMIVINRSGATLTTVTTGNILTAVSVADKAAVLMIYSKQEAKWIMGALL